MKTYTFWQGPRPDWIKLCLESLERNGVEVLTPQTWRSLYRGHPQLLKRIARQRPNVKSDYIRAHLLYHHGATWVDADCICFRPFDLEPEEFIAYRAGGEVCSALIASRAGTDTARHYLSLMEQKLMRPRRLPRNALGPTVLARAIRLGGNRTHFLPQELIHPHPHWRSRERLWEPNNIEVHPDAYCFMLTHRALGPFARMRREELLGLAGTLGDAFRRGQQRA